MLHIPQFRKYLAYLAYWKACMCSSLLSVLFLDKKFLVQQFAKRYTAWQTFSPFTTYPFVTCCRSLVPVWFWRPWETPEGRASTRSWPAREVSLIALSTASLMQLKFRRICRNESETIFPQEHLQRWWALSEILSRVVGSILDCLAADSRAIDANDAVLRSAGSSASRFSISSLSSAS